MLINKYIKSRKYILTSLLLILMIIVIGVKKKQVSKNNTTFENNLKAELKKNKLDLISVQDQKYSYKLDYQKFYFIAKIHGIKEVFSAYSRVTKSKEIIDVKDIKQLTDTPLADEELLFSNTDLFIYKSIFQNTQTVSIILNEKIIHLVFKNEEVESFSYIKNNMLVINNKSYSLDNLKTNDKFLVYTENLKKKDLSFFNDLKKLVIEYNWSNNFKYIESLGISKNKNLPFKYLKAKIPLKSSFEIYFFDKRDYFIDVVDSGGVKYSKTGVFFRNENLKNKNIYMDFEIKGGFKVNNNLIRPIITNYSTLVVDGKNHLKYGFLKKDNLEKKIVLQFGYPLIYKNKKDVEIENLKNNLKENARQNKVRTGLCIKDNLIAYFYLQGNRNLLTDYLYLIDCDYAFETDSSNISSSPIISNKPQMVLTPKNKILTKMEFKKYEFLRKFEDDILTIYEIPCGDLKLSYKLGKSDPLTNKIMNTNSHLKSISLNMGTIDPITPDGLSINNEKFYEFKNKDAFMISRSSCSFLTEIQNIKNSFYKEGFLIIKNGEYRKVDNKKYINILLGVGIRDNMIFLYQFKKSTNYKEIFKYAKDTNVKNLIIFENYGGKLDKESGRLLLNSLKNGREIYEFE